MEQGKLGGSQLQGGLRNRGVHWKKQGYGSERLGTFRILTQLNVILLLNICYLQNRGKAYFVFTQTKVLNGCQDAENL